VLWDDAMVAFTFYEIGKQPEEMKLDKYVMSKLLAAT
jgi:hypothetical protein